MNTEIEKTQELYITPLFVDNTGAGRGGYMTAEEMVRVMWQYKGFEFDSLLIDCLKTGFDKGEVEQDGPDRFKFQFRQS